MPQEINEAEESYLRSIEQLKSDRIGSEPRTSKVAFNAIVKDTQSLTDKYKKHVTSLVASIRDLGNNKHQSNFFVNS